MSRCFFLAFSSLLSVAEGVPVSLIIDTDMGGGGCMDVDDVAALCIANALADNGEVDLLAVLQNTQPPQVAGVISVINEYYGRGNVPIGAYKGPGLSPGAPKLQYVSDITENFPSPIKNSSQVPSSVDVYRRALAGQPDHSVSISSIGILTNLEALLRSEPDSWSALNGRDLVAKKVKLLAVMGGEYPDSHRESECNFCGCANPDTTPGNTSAATAAAATAYVVSHWPSEVEVVFFGFEAGVDVRSGAVLETCAPSHSPCREAFMNFKNTAGWGWSDGGRSSWDPLTTLFAVRGAAAASCSRCTNCSGVNKVDGNTGDNMWALGSASNQTYLVMNDEKAAGETLDKFLCQTPKTPSLHAVLSEGSYF